MFKYFLQSLRLVRSPLQPFAEVVRNSRDFSSPALMKQLGAGRYPIRMLRYWWAAAALASEARRRGRPLRVVDLGSGKGWLKAFTPPGCVEEWIGVDWEPRRAALDKAGYHRVVEANFDEKLPLETASVDAVVALHVFEHLPRPGFTISEVSRILRTGGTFFGGAPTMPGPMAALREKWFRRRFRQGKIRPGGHVNSLAPGRWKRLAYEVGLETELVTGSHALRATGAGLENCSWWIRLNQFWGACFPALGSECFMLARREASMVVAPVPLHSAPTWKMRPYAIGLACLAVIALLGGLIGALTDRSESFDQRMTEWIDRQQDGNDLFYVDAASLTPGLTTRSDVRALAGPSDIQHYAEIKLDPHLLLPSEALAQWASELEKKQFFITSHYSLDGRDFYLLETVKPPRHLHHFLDRPAS